MSEPLWRSQTQAHRIAVACLDMPLGILLGIPYGVTVSTWCGLVVWGARPARGRWFWRSVCWFLDDVCTRRQPPPKKHTRDAWLADARRGLETVALLLSYGDPADRAIGHRVEAMCRALLENHPEFSE